MAIIDNKTPGGSITQTNDAMNERISDISNVNKTVNAMQSDIQNQINTTQGTIKNLDSLGIDRVQSSMVGILKKINETVGSLSKGIKNVTTSTAIATKDSISQYGKAISEDISYNKQNIVAMALSRSTPIFGYFAAKFMETDIFKSAAAKLREGFGNVLGSVASKFREGFGGIVDKVKGKKGKISKSDDISSINEASLTKKPIPKLAQGGYVSKGGIAQLHPAEVVMPIEKVLSNVDKQAGTFEALLNIYKKEQLSNIGNMRAFVDTAGEKQKVGIVKGMIRAWEEVHTQYLEPDSKRQLRALLAIQDAIGAQIGTWEQVWQKTLIEHPMFRQIIFLSKAIKSTIAAPFKAVYQIFKSKGGYASHLSRNKNPMIANVLNTGLVYSEGMWRLDNITLYTKATAEATRDLSAFITGKSYPKLTGVSTGIWRISMLITKPFMMAWNKTTKSIETGIRTALIGKDHTSLAEFLTKERTVRIGARRQRFQLYQGLTETDINKKTKKESNYYDTMISCCGTAKKDRQIERKQNKELIRYNKKQSNILVKVRKSLRSKNIISMLLTAGGFIVSILKSVIQSTFKDIKLLGKGIGLLSPFIKKIATAAGFGKFLGVAYPVMLAAGAGLAIGTLLNKYIIEPIRKKIWSGKAKETETEKLQNKAIKALRDKNIKPKKRRESRVTLGVVGDIVNRYQTQQKENVGKMWSFHLDNIREGQTEYFKKNIEQYMSYDARDLTSLREQWYKKGGYKGGRPWAGSTSLGSLSTSKKYGAMREEEFLKYAKEHGKKSPVGFLDYIKDVYNIGKRSTEKLSTREAKNKIVELNAYSGQIKKGLKIVGSDIKEGSKESITAIDNMINVVMHSIQNQAPAMIESRNKRISQTKEYLNEKIITGRIN